MDSWLFLLLSILACFRLARLIAIDDGPFLIFFRIRVRMGVYDLAQNGLPKRNVGALFSCPHCLGLWIAIPFGLTRFAFNENYVYALLYWLAISGGQSALWSLTRNTES